MNTKKNLHLTLEQRIEIAECLAKGMSFKAIAKRVCKDPTTISKEVKRNVTVVASSAVHFGKDGNKISGVCPKLLKSPFACNPCTRFHCACSYDKLSYIAKRAQAKYEELLTSAREGIPLTKASFYELDNIVSTGIQKGQHLYHIMQANNLNISKATVYRHFQRGYFSATALDLPRAVKFKARRATRREFIPSALKKGKTYDDFLLFMENNALSSCVEMDTVVGRIGGKTIMTFDFTFCNFMFGILLDSKTALAASTKIIELKRSLLQNDIMFGKLFPVLLTDNGGEFANISAFETSQADGLCETKLFFCDPFQSSQKPHVEKNHTLFRDIVPKGSSFDSFTQETVNTIFSHVNSIKRKALNGKTAFEMFSFVHSVALASLLGIAQIHPHDVIQSHKLLAKLSKNS